MHEWNELYELMPKKDCGFCGNPSCRTMSRKIAVGEKKPEECMNLVRKEYAQNLSKIKKILEEGVQIGAKASISIEGGITYIHPCVSEAGKLAGEAKLTSGPEGEANLKYGFFDPYMMCWALYASKIFKKYKCSQKLGIAKIEFEEKTIIVSKNGKILVRRAENKEDVLRTIKLVARVLWASIICSCCGNASLDCASGGCDDCATRVCPVLSGGPPDPTDIERSRESILGARTFIRVDALPNKELFYEGINYINSALNLLLNDNPNIDELLNACEQKAIEFVVKTERKEDAVLGLILAGIATDLKRSSEGLRLVCVRTPKTEELLYRAKNLLKNGYETFKSTNLEMVNNIIKEYEKLKEEIVKEMKDEKLKDTLIGIEKIATNGVYIVKLLPKPLPR